MRTILTVFFMITITMLSGQRDTSYMLPVIDVKEQLSDHYLNFGGNYSSDSLNKKFHPYNSIGELPILRQQGYRNYGPGRLTSLAVRGTGAQQTAVFWEGIPVNNPMLGIADLSILIMDPLSTVSVSQGLWATHQGMGSAAGAISVDESFVKKQGIRPSADLLLASFENYSGSVHLNAGGPVFQSNFSATVQRGKNNYPHEYFGSQRELPNASHELYNAKWTGKYQINRSHSISYGTWFTEYERQIPPTRLQANSDATESGQFWRNFIRHQWNSSKLVLQSTVSFQDETFEYRDLIFNIDQANKVQHWFIQQKLSGGSHNWQWIAGWELQSIQPNSPSYTSATATQRGAVFMRSKWQFESDELIIKLRQDLSGDRMGVPVVTTIYTGELSRSLGYFAGAGTLFRWPSLDDLYWNPGGDPTLKPEYGWNAEAGLSWNVPDLDYQNVHLSLTTFFRKHVDAIQWYPDGALWYAGNRGTLRTLGLIFQTEWEYRNKGWFADVLANFQFVRSDRIDNNDGIQEIYVPKFSGAFEAAAGKGRWAIHCNHNYRSERHFLNDESSVLPGVFLSDFAVSYELPVKSYALQIQIGGRNIGDVEHEWVINRPMPGRTYYLSLKIH